MSISPLLRENVAAPEVAELCHVYEDHDHDRSVCGRDISNVPYCDCPPGGYCAKDALCVVCAELQWDDE